jgi:hypothetical protein
MPCSSARQAGLALEVPAMHACNPLEISLGIYLLCTLLAESLWKVHSVACSAGAGFLLSM